MRNLSLVAEQMSDSTRNILRAFTRNPPAMIMVTDQMIERDVVDQVLIRYLRELRDILMRKLLTTPQEENEHMGYLAEMVKREQQTAVVIEKLEHELSANIDEKEYETKRKNDLIKRLQTELHQVGKLSEEHIRRIRADAEKQEAADEKNSAGKQEKLKADVVHLRAQLLNSTTEHRKREAELRGKKYIIESEVENWILKYDEELGVRQDEYEEVDKVYKVEKKQLEELEERFATLEKEYLAIIANRRLAREKRLKEERVQEYLEKAATTIQSFWRSHKVFKAIDLRKKKQARKEQKAKKGKKGKKGKDN
ncbi:dynein regulatory complex protein 10-like isoform X1 [Babylonia areolata]|uniref:dynein regulatory complex protein 10-like isoform X1 n=1 Tax=Babylonia areolata TaxID=304850 RepID=UPI003FCFDEDE